MTVRARAGMDPEIVNHPDYRGCLFIHASAMASNDRSDAKSLKGEVRELRKEVNRKDRALAETAALLVLQKKVSAIWGNDEDSSR